MGGWYRRYREWAHANADRPTSVALAAGAGALGAGLISASRLFGWSWSAILGWVCVVGGPLAALDAWGAARHRGRHAEAWVRLGVILAVAAAGAWLSFRAR